MAEPEQEQSEKNREIVEALRETFDLLTKRLTPDLEPATIYATSLQNTDDRF